MSKQNCGRNLTGQEVRLLPLGKWGSATDEVVSSQQLLAAREQDCLDGEIGHVQCSFDSFPLQSCTSLGCAFQFLHLRAWNFLHLETCKMESYAPFLDTQRGLQ